VKHDWPNVGRLSRAEPLANPTRAEGGLMRTLWASIITVILLVGSTIGVAAQSEEKVPTFTSVTGKVIKDHSPEDDWADQFWDDRSGHRLDWRRERSIEWSDPRLPSEMVSRLNIDLYPFGPDLFQAGAETYRLDGPDGAWTGTGRGFAMNWLVVLSGEGAYEGLSAMFVRDVVMADPDSAGNDHEWFKGYIFEGELPSMPDPVEPFAE
jgi:hypothetical protein